jgi:hypothetical protein
LWITYRASWDPEAGVEGLFVSERQAGDGSGHDSTALAEKKNVLLAMDLDLSINKQEINENLDFCSLVTS